jgi:predicted nuclease of restriction endonuclease-like RecB superfamily
VRILGFPHAAEHLSKLLEAVKEAGLPVPAQMLQRCLHILRHRGPRSLLRMADRFGSELAQHKGIQEHLDYLH